MGIAIFPHGPSFDMPAPAPRSFPTAAFAQPRTRPNLSPRERIAAQHIPGRWKRRLATLSVYMTGVLISASVGPLIYAIGDRDGAVRWASDVLNLFN